MSLAAIDESRWALLFCIVSTHNAKKISKNIALLRRAKNFTTTNTLVTMYKALVLPHFTYCLTVWQQGNVNHFDKLHKPPPN